MPERYPPLEPYENGLLDFGDGQLLYWEQSGNPDGKPALALHGGPGSGCSSWMRRRFNPQAYRGSVNNRDDRPEPSRDRCDRSGDRGAQLPEPSARHCPEVAFAQQLSGAPPTDR